FTKRTVTPEQILRGPGLGGPDRSKPWRVIGVKVGGAAIGITIEDGRDERYVIKFDEVGFPEAETAADVVVQRLTWAFGYNVPDNDIVSFTRKDIVLDPKAEVKYRSGDKRPMTAADLETYLGMAEKDGSKFRGLASRLIEGKIIGGIEPSGTRKGDKNDRVPHELRRDLRGQRMLWAWVNHIDIKSHNALATYTDEKYVKWYALDFGDSLGVNQRTTGRTALGHRTSYSPTDYLKALVTFGLIVQPWERPVNYPVLRGVGRFDSVLFDPKAWKPAHHWQPTDNADRFDELWAAEKLMKLSRPYIEAAVAAGQYTDPRSAAYVAHVLFERQRMIGSYAFSQVAPLTQFTVRDDRTVTLCFEDLWLRYGYGSGGDTTYRTRTFDYEGRRMADRSAWHPASAANTCLPELPLAETRESYTIIEVELRRRNRTLPPIFVHVARGPQGLRVIGIDRR
ncbi:MAG: hypothetical protein H0T65_02755, partial [Deltaproteobacteria bacterium]|nr:hypothetical protein [Deltaproteobacteria bacterium]